MIKSTEMSNSPSKRVKDDLNRLAVKLELFGIKFHQTDASPRFHIVIDKEQGLSSNVIVIPAEEHIIYKKITRSAEKYVDAWIINEKNECNLIRFTGVDLTRNGFRRKLLMFQKYGLMTDKDYSKLFDFFMTSAKCGLKSDIEYTEDGLTYDFKYIIYKETRISLSGPLNHPDNNTAASLKATFENFIGCSSPEKPILLLIIQLIGLSMEIIKALPPEKRRNCQPTVLPYIWGDSGCGKTTISKAFFDAHDASRFISLSTSTEAAIQSKLSSVFGGVIVIDDVQHTGIGKCSIESTKKLESVIRTFGDIGAEKTTAFGKLSETGVWAAVTAESIFTTVQSSILRLLPIEFTRGEIDFERVQYIENQIVERKLFFQSFLEWFASQITINDGEILDIQALSKGYSSAKKELMQIYTDIPHARICDNHCQMLNFFCFFSHFFKMIGVEENYLCDLKSKMLSYLHRAAQLQCVHIKETSLSFYICQAIDSIIAENNVAKYFIKGSHCSNIEVPVGLDASSALTDGKSLIFTVAQQRVFFLRIKNSLPNGSNIRDNDIKQMLISMGILLDARTNKPLMRIPKDNRIRINDKDMRVLKIQINKNGGINDE